MNHSIKPLSITHETELKEALVLVQQVFQEFEAPDYSTEGIQQFKQFISLETIKRQIATKELMVWVCQSNESNIIGMIALRVPNHLSLLFVDKRVHKQGIARQLTEITTTYSQTVHGAAQITVNSSPYALAAYKHLGFTPIANQQESDGIIFTPMKKIL